MVKVVKLQSYGGADGLVVEDIALAAPGPGEIRVRHEVVGVNYVDIYQRSGLYKLPQLPAVLGVEAAGVIEAVGPDIADFTVGERVGYGLPVGAYAQARNLPAARLIKLPASVSAETAAGGLLRGLTAHMLFDRVCPLPAGSVILIHAAAGGLGLVLVQWAKRLGMTTIGTVGSEAKAALALSHGLDHAVLYRQEDFVTRVRTLTGGQGVDAAIDGVGADIFTKTLDCIRPFGTLASLGQAGGSLPALALDALGPIRSLNLARPSVFRYASDQAAYQKGAAAVVGMFETGLKIEIGARFPLADVAAAHAALESGATSGSLLLVP